MTVDARRISRPEGTADGHSVFRFGLYALDPSKRQLRRQGTSVDLNGKALDLLVLLVEARGDWVPREAIVEGVWGEGNLVSDASINQVVLKVRRALRESARSPHFIESRRHQGYRFICPIVEEGGVAEPPPRAAARSWQPRPFLVGAVLALTAVLVAAITMRPPVVADGETSFVGSATTPAELERLGFAILNPDEGTWVGRTDGLTLRTERGDFWRKEDDPILPPKNVVVKAVRSKWYVAVTELVGLEATSDTQQAGLVVLEDDAQGNYVRLTAGYDGGCPGSVRVQKVLEIRDTHYRKSETACLPDRPERIWLQIERRGDEFSFRYKTGEEFWHWRDLGTAPDELQLGQRYVGLSAFQGITSPDRQPRDQPPVNATFTRLILEPSRP